MHVQAERGRGNMWAISDVKTWVNTESMLGRADAKRSPSTIPSKIHPDITDDMQPHAYPAITSLIHVRVR